jgi:hypothetical protein
MESDKAKKKRCDPQGRAFAGSQRQIQYYVNYDPSTLQNSIASALETPFSLKWVSPLHGELFREYHDSGFLRALGLSNYEELERFWPGRGPVWDALAIDEISRGVVLVEAKSHVPEIRGSGCSATSARSIEKIEASLALTKQWLGVAAGSNWKGRLYQSANRLAHLYFFRELVGVPAWLVNIYFVDDPHSPTTRRSWDTGILQMKSDLGVKSIPHCGEVFLPATNQ